MPLRMSAADAFSAQPLFASGEAGDGWMTVEYFTGSPSQARIAAFCANAPTPTSHSGSSNSVSLRKNASQGAITALRSAGMRSSGVRFFPRGLSAVKSNGQKFVTKCSLKKSSGETKRSLKSPQRRLPLTSERLHANPSTGFAGCSRRG